LAKEKKKSGPSSTLLTEETEKEFSKKSGSIVGRFKSEASLEYITFIQLSKEEDDFRFGHRFVSGEDSITLTNFENVVSKFSGEISKKEVKEWIQRDGFPVLVELDQKVWQRSSNSKVSLFVGFIDPKDASLKELLKGVAGEFKGQIISSFIDQSNGQLAQRWGASGSKFPTAAFIKYIAEESKLFIWNEDTETEFTKETVSNFVKGAMDGTYKNYKKSEAIPETNDGPVKVVVGKTFEQIVYDETKDVLLEIYAPWCGHCQKLIPIYEKLGEKFSDVKTLVIAKIDGTANAYPDDISIQGFPSLFFFPANDKKNPITYEGNREYDDLVNFVVNHSFHKIVLEGDKTDL